MLFECPIQSKNISKLGAIAGLGILLNLGLSSALMAGEIVQTKTGLPFAQEGHSAETDQLIKLVKKIIERGKGTEALPLVEQMVKLLRQRLGPQKPELASSLNSLASLYKHLGYFSKAEAMYKEALMIGRSTLPANHPDLARDLIDLALLYKTQGRYSEAEPLYKNALAIVRLSFPNNHPNLAITLSNLAGLYYSQGRYAQAEPLFKESLKIRRLSSPENTSELAIHINNLAILYSTQGQYIEAEPLFKESLTIRRTYLPKNHPNLANALNNLAALYVDQGRYTEAEPLFKESLKIKRTILPENHPEIGTLLNNIALLYKIQGRYSEAASLYKESINIDRTVLPKHHPSLAASLSNFASLQYTRGHYKEAEDLFKEALTIDRIALPANHPNLAGDLNNLAKLYATQGRYSEAELLYKEGIAIDRASLPPDHPALAVILSNFSILHWVQNDYSSTLKYLQEGLEIEEKNLSRNLAVGGEQQKKAFLSQYLESTNRAISFHQQSNPQSSDAARLAFTTILRRKGRLLDVLGQSFQRLHSNSGIQIQTQLAQLQATYDKLSKLVSKGSEPNPSQHLKMRQELTEQAQRLTTELSHAGAELAEVFHPVDIPSIQAAIPTNAALIEFFLYRPFNPKARPDEQLGPSRYAVYILTSKGNLRWADLGPVKELDPLIQAFRRAVRDPSLTDGEVKRPAQALDTQIMQPVRQLIGNAQHLLIAPDGPLNLIPFEALIDEQDHFLLETYQITYLTSGRDLLRLHNPTTPAQAPLLLAAPTYDHPGTSATTAQSHSLSNRSGDLANLTVAPLHGTLIEGQAISQTFPHLQLITGTQATEAIVKQQPNPSFLHIATHGFFLKDQPIPLRNQPLASTTTNKPLPLRIENPLLRSGLAMAGFNLRQSGRDDGVLTALEISGLDLRATQMVVLSACDTGVGEVHNGEGIYGLRRAFTLAGAKSQLMSLWKVDDQSTKDLMVAFYEHLKQGQSRGQALRETQLAMLKGSIKTVSGGSYRHPYYWAAFIRAGDWRSLSLP